MSVSVENFVKALYSIEKSERQESKTGVLAKMLGISNAAATDMCRKLSERDLVQYQKYKDIALTEAGRLYALKVIRKHRLWETFLHQVLGLSLHEIHHEAELLEHQTSDFLAAKIEAYLGFPEFDPHGDPIPDPHGNVDEIGEAINLTKIEPDGQNLTVVRLISNDKHFFDFCTEVGLAIGCPIKTIRRMGNQSHIDVQVGTNRIMLATEFAESIYVALKN